MYCQHCGNKLPEETKFCENCGKPVDSGVNVIKPISSQNVVHTTTPSFTSTTNSIENNSNSIIKCGNCGYEGPGQKARSIPAIILAWLCVIFAWPITVIYFIATSKYRCPKCKSTFLGVKNSEGIFTKQKNTGIRALLIILFVLVGIAVLGILSSIVLASLSTARSKANDAKIVSNVDEMRNAAEIYYSTNKSYGVSVDSCNEGMFADSTSGMATLISSVTSIPNVNIDCGSVGSAYSVAASLPDGTYFCVDSTGVARGSTSAGIAYTSLTGGDTAAHTGGSPLDSSSCN